MNRVRVRVLETERTLTRRIFMLGLICVEATGGEQGGTLVHG